MPNEIMTWLFIVYLVLGVPILIRVPRAMRLATEADYLRRKADLLRAEVEMERLRRAGPAEPEASGQTTP